MEGEAKSEQSSASDGALRPGILEGTGCNCNVGGSGLWTESSRRGGRVLCVLSSVSVFVAGKTTLLRLSCDLTDGRPGTAGGGHQFTKKQQLERAATDGPARDDARGSAFLLAVSLRFLFLTPLHSHRSSFPGKRMEGDTHVHVDPPVRKRPQLLLTERYSTGKQQQQRLRVRGPDLLHVSARIPKRCCVWLCFSSAFRRLDVHKSEPGLRRRCRLPDTGL